MRLARRPIAAWLRHRRAMLILCSLGLVLLGLAALIGGAALDGIHSTQCKATAKNLGLALQNYHETYGCFPSAATYDDGGRARHSWRTMLLRDFGEVTPQGYRFGEPWDSPTNLNVAKSIDVPLFRCPADSGAAWETSYLAAVGERTFWPPNGGAATRTEVIDGLSDTLLLVEVRGSGVTWTEPRDLRFQEMPFTVSGGAGLGIRGVHGNGLWGGGDSASVLVGDGSVRSLSSAVAPAVVRSLLLRDDGESDPADGRW